MKKLILLMAIILPLIIFSQEKIGKKIYLYGKLDGKITGKTALRFNFHNTKVEKFTLEKFIDMGLDPISWTSMFLPETEYSDVEILNTLMENNVNNIIFIKLGDVEKGSSGYATSFSPSYMYYSEIETIDFVKINIEFYNLNDSTKERPDWVIIGEASGGSEFSTVTSVVKKIIRRMIDGLDEKGAFGLKAKKEAPLWINSQHGG